MIMIRKKIIYRAASCFMSGLGMSTALLAFCLKSSEVFASPITTVMVCAPCLGTCPASVPTNGTCTFVLPRTCTGAACANCLCDKDPATPTTACACVEDSV